MQNLRQSLPKLDFLLAFEAAARHESFTLAGRELNLTPSAISHAVKSLETSLDVPLFVRRPRSITLTRDGMEYLHSVTAALNHLASAGGSLRTPTRSSKLRLASDMGFADFWLFPRLRKLQSVFPDASIDLTASDVRLEVFDPNCDATIVFGNGDWPGYDSTLLFAEESFPVCSPDYLARHGPFENFDDLAAADLLDIKYEKWDWTDWMKWLTEVGGRRIEINRSFQSNSYNATILAAAAGMGIALGWRHLVEDELLSGALVIPFPHMLRSSNGCYLVYPHNRTDSRDVSELRTWIAGELKEQAMFDFDFRTVHTVGLQRTA